MLLREGFDLNTSNVINKPKVKGGSLITPKDLNTSNVINKPCQKIKLNLKILYLNQRVYRIFSVNKPSMA